eukprot:2693473-Amphidinium_carterae.1
MACTIPWSPSILRESHLERLPRPKTASGLAAKRTKAVANVCSCRMLRCSTIRGFNCSRMGCCHRLRSDRVALLAA